MASVLNTAASLETLADLLDHLGDIAPERIRLHPALGTATEADLLSVHDHHGRLCELVDGVLVETAMGFRESLLAGVLIERLRGFVRQRNLGLVTAPDGMMRLAAGLVRLPDVAFISWERLPPGHLREPHPVSHHACRTSGFQGIGALKSSLCLYALTVLSSLLTYLQ